MHEQERIGDAPRLGLFQNTPAEHPHQEAEEEVQVQSFGKGHVGRTGDRDQLATRLQHVERLFQRLAILTVNIR